MMINKKNYPIFLGAIFSQLITLITSCLLFYKSEPTIYGEFSFFISVISIIASLSTFKFEQSIVISSNNEEVFVKVILAFFFNIIITLISITIAFFIGVFDLLHIIYFFVLSVSIVLSASMQQVFLFYEKHVYNGLLALLIAAFNLFFLFFLINKSNGLIVSYVFGYGCAVSFILLINVKYFLNLKINFNKLKEVFWKNINYPIYVFPSAISGILLTYCHPIMLKFLYSDKFIGLFSISLRLLLLPTIVFGAIIGGLFRVNLAKLYLNKDYENIELEIKKNIKYLIFFCCFCFPFVNNYKVWVKINEF